MTLLNPVRKYRADGNGSKTNFDADFKIFSDSDAEVYIIDADGNADLQELNVDYTINIDSVGEGFEIQFVVAPAADEEVFARGAMAITQPTDIPNSGSLREVQIENELDRGAMIDLELADQLRRTLKFPITSEFLDLELPEPEAGKLLGWNAAADALENSDATTGAQGAQGVQGAQGSQGVQGSTGSQGPQGTQGILGSQGSQGTQGVAGSAGGATDFYGLLITNAADTANDLTIAAGQAMSDDDSVSIVLAAPITKRIDAVWAAGTNQGGLDTGTIGSSKVPVDVWLIKNVSSGVVDVVCTKNMSTPSMPSGYTKKRRIATLPWRGTTWPLLHMEGPASDRKVWHSTPLDVFAGSNLAFTTPTAIDFNSFVNPAVARRVICNGIPSGSAIVLRVRPVGFGESGSEAHTVLTGIAGTFEAEIDSAAQFEAWVDTGSYKMYLRGYKMDLSLGSLVGAQGATGAQGVQGATGSQGATGAQGAAGAQGSQGVQGAVGSGVPTGTLLDWPTVTAPTGFLLAYGQAVSRVTYADLFAVLSTTFGIGDGTTTFNLPDFRGRIALTKDNLGGASANRVTDSTADNIGESGGEETHILTEAELAAHNHDFNVANVAADTVLNADTVALARSTSLISGNNYGIGKAQAPATAIHPSSIADAGSGTAHNNLQPYITMAKIIKT